MKINWGTGIVIAFALFISFILFFVFRVQSNSKYDNELVVEEYYKHDAKFGDEMQKIQNAANLPEKPTIEVDTEGIKIVFPERFIPQQIKGKVSFYRPSAKKLDFEIPLQLNQTSLLIPKRDFAGGRWDITMSWNYNNIDYISKKIVYIN
ncbi:FixH family protein [Flavobacterium sp.]|uniref:FixH family protein n=1 Tax=Flavobacterium sp. TaxID=239 RepID=UPI00248A03C7|nr:FixH family protein [Flavobacterium sp.]MDI1317405.1 FixH family protein [Flavobacterium sp.]